MSDDTHVQLQIMTDTALKFKKQLEQTATLRDQFAMAALTGLLTGGFNHKAAAGVAYDVADAMMEVRK